ncbi:hypothetical protein O0L34_g5942 [Tuta absoluta]|nr:hypothetical protein O0L34_g5942 [Tuta absoluta]
MSQTATSNNAQSPLSTYNFIPKEFPTNKDVYGISRTVFTHVSHLHGLLSDWVRIQDKGTKVCKAVSALKLHECKDDYYPQALKPLTESLVDALESLKHIVEGVETIDRQLQALSRLQPTEEPVILTWSTSRISETITTIYKAIQKEYRLKEVITENIAHCRDENLIEVYVTSWEFDAYLNLQSNTAYLFAEVGLAGIT